MCVSVTLILRASICGYSRKRHLASSTSQIYKACTRSDFSLYVLHAFSRLSTIVDVPSQRSAIYFGKYLLRLVASFFIRKISSRVSLAFHHRHCNEIINSLNLYVRYGIHYFANNLLNSIKMLLFGVKIEIKIIAE